ncbi:MULTISPECIES: hypothetical protein [Paraburkholderia]|nr:MULTISPECIES: hypothetical protein [Paraburkholderia]MCX4153245.1 hypothetical protein [Paraburkholderia aspalathi]MDN7162659.1 hypothetical protein [Paraburkholderia sp. SECH2]MDQ6391145.1 hypothetical protein [Paraburkholderia aspalathi]
MQKNLREGSGFFAVPAAMKMQRAEEAEEAQQKPLHQKKRAALQRP